jgi:hypothetical protein
MIGKFDLGPAVDGMLEEAGTALEDVGEFLLQAANTTVPHEEGTLEGSGTTSTDRAALRTVVTYDTPYALAQHEDPDLQHKGKGRAKWLELTFKEQATRVGGFLADRIGGGAR